MKATLFVARVEIADDYSRVRHKRDAGIEWFLFLAAAALVTSGCNGTPSQPTRQPLPLSPAGAPLSSYVLSGMVFAGAVPLAGAAVDIFGQAGHSTTTGPNGSFRIVGLPKGSVALRASKKGFKTQINVIVVDGDVTYNMTLAPDEPPQALAVGDHVASVVRQDDPICATSDPSIEDGDGGRGLEGPCKTFLVTVPQDGLLTATATWPSKNLPMTILTPLHGICCWSPLTLTFAVTADSVIELSVSIHAADTLPPDFTAPFELITRLDTASRLRR